jgi:hypothetical protein
MEKILAAAAASTAYIQNNDLANKFRGLSSYGNEKWALINRIKSARTNPHLSLIEQRSNKLKGWRGRADLLP